MCYIFLIEATLVAVVGAWRFVQPSTTQSVGTMSKCTTGASMISTCGKGAKLWDMLSSAGNSTSLNSFATMTNKGPNIPERQTKCRAFPMLGEYITITCDKATMLQMGDVRGDFCRRPLPSRRPAAIVRLVRPRSVPHANALWLFYKSPARMVVIRQEGQRPPN